MKWENDSMTDRDEVHEDPPEAFEGKSKYGRSTRVNHSNQKKVDEGQQAGKEDRIKGQWFGLVRHVSYEGLNDEDIITKEESEERIIVIATFLGILLLIPATALSIAQCVEWSWKTPIVVTSESPQVPKEPIKAFPVHHVALIYQDGSVVDISLNMNLSASKQLLLKLPEDKFYFGFDNALGILNFLSATLSRPITQFYDSKHNVIPNSVPKMDHPSDYWSEALQVGNMFWVLGSHMRSNDLQVDFIYNNYVDNPNTLIYFWKRNKWVNGPKLIPGAGLINGRRATTAINSTAAMTIFQVIHEEQEKNDLATYVYNFATEGWTKFPSIEINIHNLLVAHLSSTTLISKKSKKVFLHVRFRCLIASFSLPINSVKWLFSYDLKDGSNGEWFTEHQPPTCQEREAKGRQLEFSGPKIHIFCQFSEMYASLYAIQGLLYSFDSLTPSQSVGHIYSNGIWTKINASVPFESKVQSPIPKFAIPYYTRI